MTDILITMREDLVRALSKPPAERRWAMLIDLRKCVGCHSCTLACVSEHKLPPGLYYRPVSDRESGAYPNVSRQFLPRPCMNCDQPVCVATCPHDATSKATTGVEAGTVVIDYMKCRGCGQCVRECPYQARTIDDGGSYFEKDQVQPWELAKFWEYGRSWVRNGNNPPINKARKCHFCTDRLGQGMLPACVSTCVGRATYFGDENDAGSLIAQVKAANVTQILNPAAGTLPRVSYISREPLEVTNG